MSWGLAEGNGRWCCAGKQRVICIWVECGFLKQWGFICGRHLQDLGEGGISHSCWRWRYNCILVCEDDSGSRGNVELSLIGKFWELLRTGCACLVVGPWTRSGEELWWHLNIEKDCRCFGMTLILEYGDNWLNWPPSRKAFSDDSSVLWYFRSQPHIEIFVPMPSHRSSPVHLPTVSDINKGKGLNKAVPRTHFSWNEYDRKWGKKKRHPLYPSYPVNRLAVNQKYEERLHDAAGKTKQKIAAQR